MSKESKLPTYELYIEDGDLDGLTAMGFVDMPAIKENFVYFKEEDNKTNKYVMSEVDTEKKMVVGPAMLPNKKIIRQDMFGELYYVKFTPEIIEDLAHNFLKESKQHITTEQHEEAVKDIFMIESWIVRNESDQIYTEFGYDIKNVPIGSWCIMYKIENDDIIAKIKAGEINGFSIEAFLSEKLVNAHSDMERLIAKIEAHENKDELIALLSE